MGHYIYFKHMTKKFLCNSKTLLNRHALYGNISIINDGSIETRCFLSSLTTFPNTSFDPHGNEMNILSLHRLCIDSAFNSTLMQAYYLPIFHGVNTFSRHKKILQPLLIDQRPRRWYSRPTRGRQKIEEKQENDHENKLKPGNLDSTPDLMHFPWIIWPNLWLTIRNWILANIIIRPYFDNEFSLKSFKDGAKSAVVHVSEDLSHGNFVSLEGLIVPEALIEIKKNFALFSLKQRLDLAVTSEDIFFSFPYEIGVMFQNEGEPNERIFVEITMCYHVYRGFQDYIQRDHKGMQTVYDNVDRISIVNYKFIREYTKGIEDQWTVNVANYFKPGEHIKTNA